MHLALPVFLAAPVLAFPFLDTLRQLALFRQVDLHLPTWHAVSNEVADSTSNQHGLRYQSNLSVDEETLAQYGADIVLRFDIRSSEEAHAFQKASDLMLVDIWQLTQSTADVRLAKKDLPDLLHLLPDSDNTEYTLLLGEHDLAQAVFEQYPHQEQVNREIAGTGHAKASFAHNDYQPGDKSTQDTNIFFDDYQPLSVLEPWMRLLSSLFNTHVRLITIGKSHEGRSIFAMRVGVHPTNDDNPQVRKTILVSGGSHAREWISTSTVNYVAYSLITGYGKNQMITRLLQAFDFVFIPTLNPDGYEYTWSTDRLWRKNRQPTKINNCCGIDLDRSFGFEWDASASSNPCSESFAGSEAFEATESKAYADWALNEAKNNNVSFVGFLELHSYSESILYPYSYSCDATPPGLENLQELAYGLGRAIRISGGHSYGIMPACQGNALVSQVSQKDELISRVELSGGSALDFFYHELKIPYAYQIKLRDRGTYGFLLPKGNIVPTGKEILDATLEMSNFLNDLYGLGPEVDINLPKSPESVKRNQHQYNKDRGSIIPKTKLKFDLKRRRR